MRINVDKLKLFTPHRAIPKHIRSEFFECTGMDHLRGGLKIYYFIDRAAGVHLTDAPNGLTIDFNPTKYTYGHNYQQIGRAGLAEVAQAIEDRYQTPFREWDVSGFDYNSDIEVEHHPSTYYPELGKLKGWIVRVTESTSIGYKTKSNTKAFTLYDKLVRCYADGTPVPPEDEGKHIIRPELSLNKGLSNIKELKTMRTFNDYLQPENYPKVPELWLKTYELIEKNEPVEDMPGLSRSERDMLAAIQMYTLNGYKERLRIEHHKNRGWRHHFNKVNELMQKVRAHRKLNTLTRVEELNLMVRQRAQELIAAA
jgi:hypothetical protein